MAFTSSSVLAANDQGMLTNKDKKFIHEAATGGREEVALGKLATQKASSPDVKQFGQRMVDDHSKANDQLEQLAKNKSVDLSMNKDKTDKKIQSAVDKLSKYDGADFDKHYMDMMVSDHEKDVKEFQNASKNAKDMDVKSFASDTLPTLEDHLKMAKEIQSKLGH
jgi:putative membrane protein